MHPCVCSFDEYEQNKKAKEDRKRTRKGKKENESGRNRRRKTRSLGMLRGRKRDRKGEEKGIKKWEHGFPQCICSPEAAFEILTLRQFPLDAFAEWHYRRCGYECIVRSRTRARVRFTNTASPQFSV